MRAASESAAAVRLLRTSMEDYTEKTIHDQPQYEGHTEAIETMRDLEVATRMDRARQLLAD